MANCDGCGNHLAFWNKDVTADLCPECEKTDKDSEPRKKAEENTMIIVKGKRLSCPLCGHDRFYKKPTWIKSRQSDVFESASTDEYAETRACRSCGHILWFWSEISGA